MSSSSETEAGLPGGQFRPRFSLYSTDTEEQVASVNRGLDRCAALLKSLLSPDQDTANGRQDDVVAKQCKSDAHLQQDKESHQLNTLSSRLTAQKTTGHKSSQPPSSEGREGQKHTHPHASSTPRPSREPPPPTVKPRALNDLAIQTPSDHPEATTGQTSHPPMDNTPQTAESAGTTNQQWTLDAPLKGARVVTFERKEDVGKIRKPKRAHRRQLSESRKPFVVSRNPPKPRPLVGVRVRPTQQTTASTTAHPTSTASVRKPVSSTAAQKLSMATNTTPAPTDSHPALYRLPTAVPYFPYLPSPSPLPNSWPHPQWPHPQSAGTSDSDQPPWFPYVPLWFPYPEQPTSAPNTNEAAALVTGPSPLLAPAHNPIPTNHLSSAVSAQSTHPALSAVFPNNTPSSTSDTLTHAPLTTPPAVTSAGGSSVRAGSRVGKGRHKRCSSVPLIPEDSGCGMGQGLDERERRVMREIANVEEKLKETGHSELLSCLDQLRSCVGEVCGAVPAEEPLSALPASHWLRQIGQLEQERSRLLQQVEDSESAYSEVKGQLELARSEKSSFHEQVETHRRELEVLREDLQATKKVLSHVDSQHALTKEEYLEARQLAEAQAGQMMNENKKLKEYISHLEVELSKSKNESSGFTECLSELQISMETAQEELAMIRVTISEKDTQLLQAQDQLLGLRQCLAHLLSQLKPVNSLQSGDHLRMSHDRRYTMSSQLVDKLHSLINDGDVDRFLRETSGHSSPSHLTSAEQDTRNSSSHSNSTLAAVDLDSTLVEPGAGEVEHTTALRGPSSVSTQSNQVITPLNLSMEQKSPANRTPDTSSLSDISTPTPSQFNPFPSLNLPSLNPYLKRDLTTMSPSPSARSATPLTNGSVLSRGGQSCRTTSSEMEFRRDLASLDADIARLQIQFRVALQSNP